jgi:sigma-B regulation protein RsbU (phosphoserine phosphatase)
VGRRGESDAKCRGRYEQSQGRLGRAMKQSLTTRTVVRIWVPTTVLFLAILATTYYYSRKEVTRGVEVQSRDLVRYYTARLEGKFRRVETVARMVAVYVESRPALDETALTTYMNDVIRTESDVYGSCVAFEPGAFAPGRRLFAPYYYSRDGKPTFVQLGTEDYDYLKWEWYDVPRRTGKAGWTEPYYDTGGGEAIMITFSAPFFRDGRFRGVATTDVSLSELNDEVGRIRVMNSGYAFIISRSGRFISYPDSSKVMVARLADISPDLAEQMTSGGTRFMKSDDPLTGKASWVIYSPIPATNLYLAIVFPVREVMARVFRFERSTFLLGLAGLLVLMLIVVMVARSIARPIKELAAAVRRVGGGDLDFQPPKRVTGDEVGELTMAFGKMVGDLNQHIRELRRTTAERERIASELDIAREIQRSILPGSLEAASGADSFDVHGRCIPAREVGGDFYDFFMLDPTRLGFLIGDVSGKGIAAALFMAITRTLLKSTALRGVSPGECLFRVNELLLAENRATMFVTVFYGILDAATGEVCYANAGHPYPYVLQNGKAIPLVGAGGVVLGVTEAARYETEKTRLEPDARLFLYTDGVTEAMNARGELYDSTRLEQVLAEAVPSSPEETLRRVFGHVQSFVDGAEPSDDITALALSCRKGTGQRHAGFTFANRLSEIAKLHEHLEALGTDFGLSDEAVHACTLALEEVVTNIIKYGYDDEKEHSIEVTVSADVDGEIRLTIRDDGKPFNPLDAVEPDTRSPLPDRPVGGLGIHIVRKVMDDVRYERRDGRNILTLTRHALAKTDDRQEDNHGIQNAK